MKKVHALADGQPYNTVPGEPWMQVEQAFGSVRHLIERLTLLAETHGRDARLHLVLPSEGYSASIKVETVSGKALA